MLTANVFRELLDNYAQRLLDWKDVLNDLDNRIGDGDHGTNMERGFTAVNEKWKSSVPDDLSSMCQDAGMTLLGKVGGASGPLYGTVFLKLSGAWRGTDDIDLRNLLRGLESAYEALCTRGKASVGDKTMLDVWRPTLDCLRDLSNGGDTTTIAFERVAGTAQSAALATKDLAARKGRAAYLGERSRGTCDPGAVSSAIFFEEVIATMTDQAERLQWNVSAL